MVSNTFVVALGVGTVFFGLICIVVIIKLMSALIQLLEKNSPDSVKRGSVAVLAAPAAVKNGISKRDAAIIMAVMQRELTGNIESISIEKAEK